MSAWWLAPLLLLGPAQEPALNPLQVAWASQYEWKDDGVETATIDFRLKWVETWAPDGSWETERSGRLVADRSGLVRLHLPGVERDRRRRVAGHVAWVVARFARKPYAEAFAGLAVGAAEKGPGDVFLVSVQDERYRLRNGRIVGVDRVQRKNERTGKAWRYTEDFVVRDVRGGYSWFETRASYTSSESTQRGRARREIKHDRRRELTIRHQGEVPFPQSYRYVYRRDRGAGEKLATTVTVEFDEPRINAADAVVLDPAARDLLAAAWKRRYTLPRQIRVTGNFVLKSEMAADLFGVERLEGEFQVWGLDQIEAKVDAERLTGRGGGSWWLSRNLGRINDALVAELKWLYGQFHPRPFEEAFAGCGFRRIEDGDSTVIQISGHPDTLAYRIRGGVLVGRLQNTASGDAWWTHKLKKLPDGRVLIDRMTRRVGRKKYEQRITTTKKKGLHVPTKFWRLRSWTRRGTSGETAYGISAWQLKRPRVEVPETG
ncbi:MAG: hypothetical protein ACE5JG_02730 [Planctomycetota bacterium]